MKRLLMYTSLLLLALALALYIFFWIQSKKKIEGEIEQYIVTNYANPYASLESVNFVSNGVVVNYIYDTNVIKFDSLMYVPRINSLFGSLMKYSDENLIKMLATHKYSYKEIYEDTIAHKSFYWELSQQDVESFDKFTQKEKDALISLVVVTDRLCPIEITDGLILDMVFSDRSSVFYKYNVDENKINTNNIDENYPVMFDEFHSGVMLSNSYRADSLVDQCWLKLIRDCGKDIFHEYCGNKSKVHDLHFYDKDWLKRAMPEK